MAVATFRNSIIAELFHLDISVVLFRSSKPLLHSRALQHPTIPFRIFVSAFMAPVKLGEDKL